MTAESKRKRRLGMTPVVLLLVVGAIVAWVITVLNARKMGNMPGTMGMSLVSFSTMWTLMMTAMMLPSVMPLAARYVRAIDGEGWVHTVGLLSFVAGYLGVWTATGVLAFWLADLTGTIAFEYPDAATWAAAATYALCGIYQFTPLKYACLTRCRAPVTLLLQYGTWRGRTRHFRVGVHHGLFCLGCCWMLMIVMFATGTMNIGAMLALTLVIAVEKLWASNDLFPKLIGVICLGLAIAVIWIPELAPGMIPQGDMMMMMDMGGMDMGGMDMSGMDM